MRADQRKSAKQMLVALHKCRQAVFRKRWPRRADALRQAASKACAQVPHELPAPGASTAAWQALAASLAQCSAVVESFWRACNGEGFGDDDSEDDVDDFDDFLGFGGFGGYSGRPRCDSTMIRDLWQCVMECEEAVTCLSHSVACLSGRKSALPSGATSLDTVTRWLTVEGFGEYAPRFHTEKIDARALRLLTDNHLQSLGVARLGDRLNLLQAISERAPQPDSAELATAPADVGHAAPPVSASRPKSFLELVRLAAQMRDGGIIVRHWVPGGVG